MKLRRLGMALLLVLGLAGVAAADVVVLWDESTYRGTVTGVDDRLVVIRGEGREVRIDRTQVAAIQFAPPDAILGPGPGSELPDEDTGVQTPFGNTGRHRGWLVGTVYDVAGMAGRIPDFAVEESLGTLYTPSLNITPRRIYGLSPLTWRREWFGIAYEGAFEVTAADSYTVELTSDDGSMLYLDGALLLDNGGNHPPRSRTGERWLGAGWHRLRVEYFQGTAEVALVLKIARAGGALQLWEVAKPLGGKNPGSGPLF